MSTAIPVTPSLSGWVPDTIEAIVIVLLSLTALFVISVNMLPAIGLGWYNSIDSYG